ncbi:hypothetical protein GGI25_005788 [Coemansia spiralis]|uniref:Uncharacterized protein n=2 Tax=Coemansia TaxID=4863 RepID=A0A9W8G398_9FUNG|nr:hypothetical protein BX070DRAFT_224564 [Coemansia spiralis]KAJ1987371.1 hypothetical protein EDC05_005871 [Coemansia umbellata]KAJ2619284.1 hypothetical protein GGI26_005963 [Coemansia sp. RSA 1358]KAJ2670619.1 hypothetical protein GGI25_005788 [Coemansia spiralis]
MSLTKLDTELNQPRRSPTSLPFPLFDRIQVQCTDPDIKREALSELFDHCMTPITATFPLNSNMWYAGKSNFAATSTRGDPCSQGYRQCRPRPLSAAPTLNLELLSHHTFTDMQSAETIETGLLSPVSSSEMSSGNDEDTSSSRIAALLIDDQCLFEDNAFETANDAVADSAHAPELGTFADLRRKLYGGDIHSSSDSFAYEGGTCGGAEMQVSLQSD